MWSNGLHAGSSCPSLGPWAPRTGLQPRGAGCLQLRSPCPGQGSPAQPGLAQPGTHGGGAERWVPSRGRQLLNLEAVSSAMEAWSALSQWPWGLSGIPSANAGAVGGRRGLLWGAAVMRPAGEWAPPTPLPPPPEISLGAGGLGRWSGSPREAASGRRWEAPSNNGLKIEQAAPQEADPSGEGVGAGRLPGPEGPQASVSLPAPRGCGDVRLRNQAWGAAPHGSASLRAHFPSGMGKQTGVPCRLAPPSTQ